MNIVNKLTVRHLKENKRRTLVTIIGVIISVAMVMAVATLGVSFMDLLQRQSIATDGEWHVQYENVDSNQIEAIESDKSTKTLILANDVGYAKLDEPQNESKPYLFIKEYNEQGFKNFPIEISEGRLPQEDNEIVLSEEVAGNAKLKHGIGDQITLNVGKRLMEGVERPFSQKDPLQTDVEGASESLENENTRTYTIVGKIKRPTWEPAWAPGYTAISYVDQSLMNSKDTVDAVVVLDKVKRSLYKHAETLAKQNNIENVTFNDELLRYYGVTDNDNLLQTMLLLTGIIMSVIIIGSVALIYNAFAISVSERSRHLGMLASVGATKRQKQTSVFFEGAIIGLISIPLGVLAGFAGIAATFMFINSFIEGALGGTEKLQVVVTPLSVLVACGISIITIFISSYMPARKASKISAIDAIRQTQDIKLSGKTVKTSKLIRKLFGIEAEIGLKNLKRNKRRYQVTVFSLVISIILFLSVSYFTSNLEKSVELSQQNINYDIQISGNSVEKEDLEPFTNLKNVTNASIINELMLNTYVDDDAIPDGLEKNLYQDESLLKDGKYQYNAVLHGLDEQSFNEYAKKVGMDAEKLQDPEKPAGILIENVSYMDPETSKIKETKSLNARIGESIELYSMNYETEEVKLINNVEIGALTDELPMGVSRSGAGGLDFIVSEETMNGLIDKEVQKDVRTSLYMNSSDSMATQEAIEEGKRSDLYVYNVFQNRQRDKQMILFMSVFTYGFISLISLISIANIFNTISTSISLRKREFAMLKSIGMTPKGFNKMMNYESIFYGMKAILYGIPISIAIMFLMYLSFRNTFVYGFTLPWMSLLFVIIAIFIIVGSAMFYSIKKLEKNNIVDTLKQENV
ncbi:ABC transporter permease [Bacillus sp. es.036]|uniref:ABC transporter permease n=1 Tax=Bacillus sp. es.036 TaxID=1761764 RepID=UPI000BF6480D|nr:ABC transporter permease [Bacillus sp. es.036]PFG15127.1 putative ABC transport system permease protein [Bacillus sp. es.036]